MREAQRQAHRSMPGEDISKSIRLTFMEAVKGCTKSLKVSYPFECPPCQGNGSKGGKEYKACDACNGQGKVGRKQGFMQMITTCPSCRGQGYKILIACDKCKGSGYQSKDEVLKVTIPAGVDNGMSIRLAGKGMTSPYGGPSGSLYVSMVVSPHSEFERSGPTTIVSEKDVSYLDAILGTKVQVNTIHGKLTMKVPAGTQPESLLRIPQKGVHRGEEKGDHIVQIKIKLPKKTSKEEKELLNKLKDL